MDEYKFCVSGKNCTLGIFPTMKVAEKAILMSDPDATALEMGGFHAAYWSPRKREMLNVVACRASCRAEKMF